MDTKQKYAELPRETLVSMCASMETYMRAWGIWPLYRAEIVRELELKIAEEREREADEPAI